MKNKDKGPDYISNKLFHAMLEEWINDGAPAPIPDKIATAFVQINYMIFNLTN